MFVLLGVIFPGTGFCLCVRDGSLVLAFYLKYPTLKKTKDNPDTRDKLCRMCGGTKSVTGKITEGKAVGKDKKDRGNFVKYC